MITIWPFMIEIFQQLHRVLLARMIISIIGQNLEYFAFVVLSP